MALKHIINHTLKEEFASCTGCAACAAVCPISCISMVGDEEGFLQPNIDTSLCIDCGVCRKVCPVNKSGMSGGQGAVCNHNGDNNFLAVWAAWSLDDDIRFNSSSGGVFSVLAENILQKGGVVVGAAFDDSFGVQHIIIKDVADLPLLRGSKYAQSKIDPSLYEEIKKILQEDRLVLFSGVPCQVAGLRSVLKKPSPNLFCCDILCHGVPSPKLWKRYLAEEEKKKGQVYKISFRHKETGWKKYSLNIEFLGGKTHKSNFFKDPYMKAFLSDIALRSSCYHCQFARLRREGDLTLADFWGVEKKYPEYDAEDKGTSLILVNNHQGEMRLDENRAQLFLGEADLDTAVSGNPVLIKPARRPVERDVFFHDLSTLNFNALKKKYKLCPPSFFMRVAKGMKRRLLNVVRMCLAALR